MRNVFFLLLMAGLLLPLAASAQELVWSKVMSDIRDRYPAVEHISVDSLADWISAGAHPQPLLLDVREQNEYEVSHLMGAIQIDPDMSDLSALEDIPRWTPIVAYCSVGYRSSALADRLREAGFTRIVNLEGSIFTWANAGHPVYRGEAEVQAVHPYNTAWGQLLNRDLRSKKVQ